MFHPSGAHILILILVIVVIFGAAKLPSVAKNLGKSMKVFRNEVKDLREDDSATAGPAADDPKQISQSQRAADDAAARQADPSRTTSAGETDARNPEQHSA